MSDSDFKCSQTGKINRSRKTFPHINNVVRKEVNTNTTVTPSSFVRLILVTYSADLRAV